MSISAVSTSSPIKPPEASVLKPPEVKVDPPLEGSDRAKHRGFSKNGAS